MAISRKRKKVGKAVKVWAVIQRNGVPNGVSFKKTHDQAADDLDAKYGEQVVRATLTLSPQRGRG